MRACPTTQMGSAIAAGLPFTCVLINYTRAGIPFTNHLTLEPLCLGPVSPGPITHYVGTLRPSPCSEAPSREPQLTARFDGLSMNAPAAMKTGACDAGCQSLACRRLATELIATNGYAPVTVPQLVRPGSLPSPPAPPTSPFDHAHRPGQPSPPDALPSLPPPYPHPSCLDMALVPAAQLTAMASLLPIETAAALIELVQAVLRNDVEISAAEFDGALRILLGVRTAQFQPRACTSMPTHPPHPVRACIDT